MQPGPHPARAGCVNTDARLGPPDPQAPRTLWRSRRTSPTTPSLLTRRSTSEPPAQRSARGSPRLAARRLTLGRGSSLSHPRPRSSARTNRHRRGRPPPPPQKLPKGGLRLTSRRWTAPRRHGSSSTSMRPSSGGLRQGLGGPKAGAVVLLQQWTGAPAAQRPPLRLLRPAPAMLAVSLRRAPTLLLPVPLSLRPARTRRPSSKWSACASPTSPSCTRCARTAGATLPPFPFRLPGRAPSAGSAGLPRLHCRPPNFALTSPQTLTPNPKPHPP
jgi:hypothetical protein